MLKYQNINPVFQKAMLQIGQRCFVIKDVENTVNINDINIILMILTEKKLLKCFMNCKNKSKKVIKRKGGKHYMLNGKLTIVFPAVGLIKKT